MVKAREILRRRAHAAEANRMAKATNRNPHRTTHEAGQSQKTRLQSQTRLRHLTHQSEKRRQEKTKTQIRKTPQTHGSQKIQTRKKFTPNRRRTHSQKIPQHGSPEQLLGWRRWTPQMVRSHTRRQKPSSDKNRQRHKLDNRETAQPQSFPKLNKCRQKSAKLTQERQRR